LDWRDKTLVQFGASGTSSIDEIDIIRGTEKLSMKKDGDEWKASDGRKLQQAKIADVLGAIQGQQATAFLDSPKALAAHGLDKPRLEVVLREKTKEVAALKFGNDSRSPAGVYLKSPNPSILIVGKDLYDKLNLKWSDLEEPQTTPETSPK